MKSRFALTMGDPCGIGPEIILKALKNHPDLYNHGHPVVVGDKSIFLSLMQNLGIQMEIMDFTPDKQINPDPDHLYCLDLGLPPHKPEIGQITAAGGRYAYTAIKKAIECTVRKIFSAIVTAPINKEALQLAKVPYLDHTEILTRLTNSVDTMTLFVTGPLRVFFYSRHIPLRDVAASLSAEQLDTAIMNSCRYLEQIGIARPRLAVAALNPHGGEQGMFGDEELKFLFPAVERARNRAQQVFGPIPADSVFHLAKEGTYDAVLSLYHDQGHIATKTLDFHRTVSLTMGLPFLRTSVDHGTALDIAGTGKASEISMVEAVKAAASYAW